MKSRSCTEHESMKKSSITILWKQRSSELARAFLHCKRDCNTNYVDIIQYARDLKNTTTNYSDIIHKTEKITSSYVDITGYVYLF